MVVNIWAAASTLGAIGPPRDIETTAGISTFDRTHSNAVTTPSQDPIPLQSKTFTATKEWSIEINHVGHVTSARLYQYAGFFGAAPLRQRTFIQSSQVL